MKINWIFILLIFGLSGAINSLSAQENFRIEAAFSAKEKTPSGKSKLTIGTVYFDKNDNKIVYDITFPNAATLVVTDSIQYIVKDDTARAQPIPSLNQLSIFNLALKGDLDNFGLEQLKYDIIEVEKSQDMVITTWLPPADFQKNYGKIAISQKDRNLYGVVFFAPDDTVIGKQIFRNYVTIDGVSFPQEVIQITIVEGEEFYKVTTFSNVKINNLEKDEMYQFNTEQLNILDK